MPSITPLPAVKLSSPSVRRGNQARLLISDNGPGIPAEDLPHIFERFYRGEKSRTRSRDGKGFGLGLSIAYWIVMNHHGKIDVDFNRGQRYNILRLAAPG